MSHDNYHEVVHQMEEFGVQFRPKDLPLTVDGPKRRTCGKGGKWWYWLSTFRRDAGGAYIVGAYGSYKTGERSKVIVNWQPLNDAERRRRDEERQAAEAKAREARAEEARLAALSAAALWREASPTGKSPYLERKQVEAEACRYLRDGSILVPLLRYDLPREQRFQAVQRIWPRKLRDPETGEPTTDKTFTRDFSKPRCACRLGEVWPGCVILVCEGYATGLTLRMAIARGHPVFVALDAYNLGPVTEMLRELYPQHWLLICADDDWRTRDHEGKLNNPGRTKAREAAKAVGQAGVVYPIFTRGREPKDTDFNDLQLRAGLAAVSRQLRGAIAGTQEMARAA